MSEDPTLLGGTQDARTDPSTPRRPPSAPLSRGALVGPYVLLDRLGEGVMGTVYAAFDPRLDRRIAIELLRDPARARPRSSMARRCLDDPRSNRALIERARDIGEAP